MPKLQAAVPKGAPPNALLRVRLPDGTECNVRIPEGLSEGQEFVFEVDSVGGLTTSSNTSQNVSHTPKSSSKRDSLNKSNKHAKKKNKKSNHASTTTNNRVDRVDKAPSFVTIFFNYYNLVYDTVMNTLYPPPTHKVQQSPNVTTNQYVRLLDREIATGVDFCVALCVGIFIGLSIVVGFVAGVLWVTPVAGGYPSSN